MANQRPQAEITGRFTKGEIGQSGTIVTQGFIGLQDWDREMIGLRGLRTIDKMRNSDPTIKAAFTAITEPIIQANWFLTPASDDPLDEEISDFVDDNLMEGMSITFTDFLRQALLYLAYGYYVFEIVYDYDPEQNKIVWRKFAPRLPWTITKWTLADGGNGIVQQLPDGKEVEIPIEKLIVFVHEKEGDNWTGRSIFRPAFNSYKFKIGLERIDAVAHERQGLGIPQMSYPAGATDEQKKDAEKVLRNIRAHQQAHVLLTEGWTFEITDMKGSQSRNAAESIKYHNRQMLMSMLAQFLELGSGGNRGSTGSYALSQDQSRIFELTLGSYCKHIAEAFNRYVIPRLVDMNYNGVKKYPQLGFSKLGDIDMNIWSTAVQRLVAAQAIHPDENIEDYARDIMDLPEITPEERAELELEKFLNEMEGKPVFNPPPAQTAGHGFGTPAQGQTTTAAEGDKQQVTQDQAPADGSIEDDMQKANDVKNELALFINEKRMELIKRRKNGNQFSPEEVQQIILDILQKKQDLGEKALGDTTEAKESSHDILVTMNERINHAITNLESEQA